MIYYKITLKKENAKNKMNSITAKNSDVYNRVKEEKKCMIKTLNKV